jgi:hypothetical protein
MFIALMRLLPALLSLALVAVPLACSSSDPDGAAGAGGTWEQCSTTLEGEQPFATNVQGSTELPTDAGEVFLFFGAQLYFPQGRRPLAPVVLAHADLLNQDLSVWSGTLDAQGMAAGMMVRDHCEGSLLANLVGPSGGLQAEITYDLKTGEPLLKGPLLLCPKGSAQPARLELSRCLSPNTTSHLPTASVAFSMTTPVEPATLQPLNVAGMSAAVTVSEQGGRLVLAPASGAFPPGEWSLPLSSLRDVMGASYQSSVKLSVLKPAAAVQDPSLAALNQQAVAVHSGKLEHAEGVLRLTPDNAACGMGAVIGLGGEAGHTQLRLRHRFACQGSATSYDRAKVVVVASDGASVQVPVGCDAAPQDHSVTLPGMAPWYLVLDELKDRPLPCGATPPDVQDQWELDEFEFGP